MNWRKGQRRWESQQYTHTLFWDMESVDHGIGPMPVTPQATAVMIGAPMHQGVRTVEDGWSIAPETLRSEDRIRVYEFLMQRGVFVILWTRYGLDVGSIYDRHVLAHEPKDSRIDIDWPWDLEVARLAPERHPAVVRLLVRDAENGWVTR